VGVFAHHSHSPAQLKAGRLALPSELAAHATEVGVFAHRSHSPVTPQGWTLGPTH
jgi:hypothetical protein